MAMGSSFGDLFRISTFGESHGGGVGVIVEGCPPRLNLSVESIQAELDRRKPGQSHITTPRKEADQVEILRGLLDGETTLGMVAGRRQVAEAIDLAGKLGKATPYIVL